MSDILQHILDTKRREVAAARAAMPMAEMERRARAAPPARDFVGALRAKIAAGRPAAIFARSAPTKSRAGGAARARRSISSIGVAARAAATSLCFVSRMRCRTSDTVERPRQTMS